MSVDREALKEPHCVCDGWDIGEYRQIGGAMCPCCAHCGLPLKLRHRTFENAIDSEYCIECGQGPGSEAALRLSRMENDRLRQELATAKLYLAAVAASPSFSKPAGADEENARLRAKVRKLKRKLRRERKRVAAAYQIVGGLAHLTDTFDAPDVQRALDYLSGREIEGPILPWPREEIARDKGDDPIENYMRERKIEPLDWHAPDAGAVRASQGASSVEMPMDSGEVRRASTGRLSGAEDRDRIGSGWALGYGDGREFVIIRHRGDAVVEELMIPPAPPPPLWLGEDD